MRLRQSQDLLNGASAADHAEVFAGPEQRLGVDGHHELLEDHEREQARIPPTRTFLWRALTCSHHGNHHPVRLAT
jgi:hypothetical protein